MEKDLRLNQTGRPRLSAVLFDLDGSLLEPVIDFDGLRKRLGVPPGESLLDWIDSKEGEERIRSTRILEAEERRAAEESRLLPGARETLQWLVSHSVPVAILTRNSRASWEIVQPRCGLTHIRDVFTREDADPKPNPACIRQVLRKWNLEAEQVIHVGDYLYDLELARATGMYSILIRASGENPYPVSCDFVARDHRELLGHLAVMLDMEITNPPTSPPRR